MSRATDTMMDALHLLTAEKLADIIRNGVEVVDKETGDIVRVTASAAYLAAAIKFLKDNDVTADSGSGRFNPLKDALGDVPVYDDDEADYPTRVN